PAAMGPQYTLATASIAAQSSTSATASTPAVVQFTVTTPAGTAGGVLPVPQVTWSGAAIRSAGAAIGAPSAGNGGARVLNGTVTVNLWPGASLGSGSYTGTVTLTLCYDGTATSCNSQLAGGRRSI